MPRLRIHFQKTDDLRWISHRDLVRVMERLFRRGELKLKMSEGFHPKPKLNFPSALALGIEGRNELMEVELEEPLDSQVLVERLRALAPPGLVILAAELQTQGSAKPQLKRTTYQVPVPAERHGEVQQAIDRLMACSSYPLARAGRQQPVDARDGIEELDLVDGKLRMVLTATRDAGVRPRDVLEILQLADLEQSGCFLSRTCVEVTP